MKKIFLIVVLACMTLCGYAQNYPPTPQDKGYPYTQTGYKYGMEQIRGTIALFPGTRYAYIDGVKIRMDHDDLLQGWSIKYQGKLYVPKAFAGVLAIKKYQYQPLPKGLEILQNRWVYDFTDKIPAAVIPAGIGTVVKKGKTYFDVAAYAKYLHKQVLVTPRGVVLISDHPITYNEQTCPYADAVIALFDTPEKYADPQLSIKYIPYLKHQGDVRNHARITPAQWNELENGEETEMPITPRSQYDFSGFNAALLGSAPPAPGIYPRILFSEKDIPMLKKQISQNVSAQKSMTEIEILLKKTWLDPSTSDGQIFKLLEDGNLDVIRSKQELPKEGAAVYWVPKLTSDHKPGIYNSHINYVTNCLTTMALYALLTDNNELGKRVAKAVYTYFRLVEPYVEKHLGTTDSEFGTSFDGASNSTTHWRGMHGVVPHMDMALALDFSGKWMDEVQKKFMQNLIAKATYGRRTGAGDGPRTLWRDINHMTWHLTHLLALSAIEGLPGFDAEGYASDAELTRDFLEFGIDKNGQIFESNGKSGGGLQFQMLSMILLARRGNNLFGHPHFRKLLATQVYTTSPNGKETVSSGTWGGSKLSLQTVSEIKAFYPNDKNADYLLSMGYPDLNWKTYDLNALRSQLEKKISGVRLPGPSYPGFGLGFPYVADWDYMTSKEHAQKQLDWSTNVQGIFSSSSDYSPNAAWLCFQVRDNHYIGSGHHHSDIGMFYFSGNGVNWITESPYPKTYDARYHNLLLIDGIAESAETPAKGDYLGAKMNPNFASASADLSYAYSWQWCTQVKDWGTGFSTLATSPYKDYVWELETRPEILNRFKGTANYKLRIWWATSNQANFIPTLRSPWNPVRYVYRSVGLVKGSHPFGIVADDAQKDDNNHKYQWTAMTASGVWQADIAGLPENCIALAHDADLIKFPFKEVPQQLKPHKGDAVLLLYALGMKKPDNSQMRKDWIRVEMATDGPEDNKPEMRNYGRIVIDQIAKHVNYRVLMVPYRMGEPLPKIEYNANKATIIQGKQSNTINFSESSKGQTQVACE
jgi:hypothetical protein